MPGIPSAEAGGVVWRRSEPADAAAQPEAFPSLSLPAPGMFPSLPSPWDDPDFYRLGLHTAPPPPQLAAGMASAAAAGGAPEHGDGISILWQRQELGATPATGPAAGGSAAAANGSYPGILWQRAADSEPAAATAPDAFVASPAETAAADSSTQGGGRASDGGALPGRPVRLPVILSRRGRGGRNGSPGASELQDDPAVLDNLDDDRPVAVAGGRSVVRR